MSALREQTVGNRPEADVQAARFPSLKTIHAVDGQGLAWQCAEASVPPAAVLPPCTRGKATMKAAILIICLAASISVAAADREYRYQYLGCYKDADQRDLGEKQWQDGRMTQRRCINFCGENGFSYAGAQYGGQCFCGNSYGRYGKLAENNCNVPCNGDSGRHCGGTWANSMFKISDTSMPGGPPARTTSSATYLGCYKDADQRDLNERHWEDGRMTQDRCISSCRESGFAYAAVQYGGHCFCGNAYGKYGKIAESNCNMSCSGDSSHHCGGTWANSIFEISNGPKLSDRRYMPTEGAASGSAGAITTDAIVEVEDSNGPIK